MDDLNSDSEDVT